TFVALAKGYDKEGFEQTVEKFIPLYTQILQELKEAGATWVQIDEPIFSTNVTEETVALAEKVYGAFAEEDRKSTRLNSSHVSISYAVFCWKKKKNTDYAYESHGKV